MHCTCLLYIVLVWWGCWYSLPFAFYQEPSESGQRLVKLSGSDQQEWSYTLYDFEGQGHVTREVTEHVIVIPWLLTIKWDIYSTVLKEALSVLMLCVPRNNLWPCKLYVLYSTKMVDFEHFCVLSIFSWKKLAQTQKSVLNMASSDSQMDKPQCGHPKRAEHRHTKH